MFQPSRRGHEIFEGPCDLLADDRVRNMCVRIRERRDHDAFRERVRGDSPRDIDDDTVLDGNRATVKTVLRQHGPCEDIHGAAMRVHMIILAGRESLWPTGLKRLIANTL